MTTEEQAKEIRDAIQLLNKKEQQEQQTIINLKIQEAKDWVLSITPKEPTTRKEALKNFNQWKNLLQTEQNPIRRAVLSQRLKQANEIYKMVKKVEVNREKHKGLLAKIKEFFFG